LKPQRAAVPPSRALPNSGKGPDGLSLSSGSFRRSGGISLRLDRERAAGLPSRSSRVVGGELVVRLRPFRASAGSAFAVDHERRLASPRGPGRFYTLRGASRPPA
jgi:hypothetical protein